MSAKTARAGSKAQLAPAASKEAGANALWGGRFEGAPDALMEAINASITFDKRLYAHDIAGSKAHAQMLVEQGIITAQDGRAIAKGPGNDSSQWPVRRTRR